MCIATAKSRNSVSQKHCNIARLAPHPHAKGLVLPSKLYLPKLKRLEPITPTIQLKNANYCPPLASKAFQAAKDYRH